MAQSQETKGGDQSYFDQYAGQGTDAIGNDAVSTQYLSMVQPDSAAATLHKPGIWINSATSEEFGPSIEIIPMAFKTVWTERDKEPPYMTVGRYEPHSIKVLTEYPKPGQKGFPKMTNPITGNQIQELFLYAVMVKNRPELGILYFSPTVGSMKACKAWNGLIKSTRLSSGVVAPMFAYSYILDLDMVASKAMPNKKNAQFVRATRGPINEEKWFIENVKPLLDDAQKANMLMIAAPETSGEVEENE